MFILEICTWLALSLVLAFIHVYGPTERRLNIGSTAFGAIVGALAGGGFARIIHIAPMAVGQYSFMQLIFAGIGAEVMILFIRASRRPTGQPPLAGPRAT